MKRLLCDFDGRIPHDFPDRLQMIARIHQLSIVWVRYDRTEHGWHVVVACTRRLAFWRVVALQAILGSDWKREVFNSRRVMTWRHVPALWRSRANVLYARHIRGISI